MKSIEWANGKVLLLDQTRLPAEQVVLEIEDYRDMIEAIKSLRIRGAPALGVAAAYGIVIGAQAISAEDRSSFLERLDGIIREIVASRPTAVNIAWAADRMRRAAPETAHVSGIKSALLDEAARILAEDVDINMFYGRPRSIADAGRGNGPHSL